MKIGVTSDTHGNRKFLIKALSLFSDHEISDVLHCGDLEDAALLNEFHQFKLWLALGNCDDESKFIKHSQNLPMVSIKNIQELSIDGKSIIVLHGHNKRVFNNSVSEQKYHYIIKGHSHQFEDYIMNGSRILNPGALFRSAVYTIGILDLAEDKWTKIDLN